MHYTFTPQDILAYVYGELDTELAVKLESLLPEDEQLRNEIKMLQEAKTLLDSQKPELSPSQSSIDSIMEFASKKAESKFGIGLYQ